VEVEQVDREQPQLAQTELLTLEVEVAPVTKVVVYMEKLEMVVLEWSSSNMLELSRP
jgi:hypothetical protein